MQSLYPVEKAIRPGCPLSIGGQGQELRYVSGLYMPAHGVLADAIFPRYAAICALPSRQQLLDSKALLVRANGTDPTQLLLLIHAVMSAAPALWRAYAVAGGVPFHHVLAFLGCRSSFEHV